MAIICFLPPAAGADRGHPRPAGCTGHRSDVVRLSINQDQQQEPPCERSTGKVAGFYTLSAHSIPLNDVAPELAKKLPRYPSVPVVLIGWMGRDLAFRGAGVGSLLLYDAISRVAKAPVGAYAICADAIDDLAAAFYRDHQFQPLVSRPQSLFLPMKTALALVSG